MVNFNCKNIGNQVSLSLSVDNQVQCDLIFETVTKDVEGSNFKLVSYKNEIQKVNIIAFEKFFDQVLNLNLFSQINPNSLNILKSVLFSTKDLQDICYLVRKHIKLANNRWKFKHLINDQNISLMQKMNTCLDYLLALNENLRNSLDPLYNQELTASKSQIQAWYKSKVLDFSKGNCKDLDERIKKVRTLYKTDTKQWTVTEFDEALEHNFIFNTYKNLYNKEITLFSYKNLEIDKRLAKICKKIKTLNSRLRALPSVQIAKETARIGKVRAETIEDAINSIVEGFAIDPPENFKSTNKIFILPQTFLKVLLPQAALEEEMIRKKFSFSQSDSVVPSFTFKDVDLSRLGTTLDAHVSPERRFPLAKMSLESQQAFAIRLDYKRKFFWERVNQKDRKLGEKSYEFFKTKKFRIKTEKDELLVSFSQLLRSLRNGLYVAFENDSVFHVCRDFISQFSVLDEEKHSYAFLKAFQFYNQIDKFEQAFFTLDIDNPETNSLISACEGQQWEYKSSSGLWVKAPFRTLYELWMHNEISSATLVRIDKKEILIGEEKQFQLQKALETPPSFVIPELLEASKSTLLPLHHISAKPNLKYLWTFDAIGQDRLTLRNIFKKLTDRSFHKAFLTLYHQFQDLHVSNLGAIPILDEDFHHWNQYKFYLPHDVNQAWSLFELMQLYVSEEIDDKTSVMAYDPSTGSRLVISEIGNHKRLHSVLNCAWELQIFDSDRVSGESANFITYLCKKKGKEAKEFCANLAIRHCLLGVSDFKDSPLSLKSRKLIEETLEDKNPENYCFNKHSFIWQFIHPSLHAELEKLILEKISKSEYTLSHYLKQKMPIHNELLRKKMAQDLSDLSSHKEFWETINKSLVSYKELWKTVNKKVVSQDWFKPHKLHKLDFLNIVHGEEIPISLEETFQRIGQAYNLTVEELYLLNQDKKWIEGEEIIVRESLTADTSSAKKQREKIALAFMPQETYLQRQGRLERKANCSKFLSFQERLMSLKSSDSQKIVSDLCEILSDPVHPFTAIKRMELQEKAHSLSTSLTKSEHLQSKRYSPMDPLVKEIYSFLELMIKEYLPTFEKLAFVMNPFLADVKELLIYRYGITDFKERREFDVGNQIGHFEFPIETVIEEAREMCKSDKKILDNIDLIEARIQTEIEQQIKMFGSLIHSAGF